MGICNVESGHGRCTLQRFWACVSDQLTAGLNAFQTTERTMRGRARGHAGYKTTGVVESDLSYSTNYREILFDTDKDHRPRGDEDRLWTWYRLRTTVL